MGQDNLWREFSLWCNEIKNGLDNFSNDIQIAFREFDDDVKDIVKDSVEGIPILEQIVDINHKIDNSTKTFLTTLSNPASPQAGQLVKAEQLEKADHIFVKRSIYTHHGIYAGHGTVIHYAQDKSGKSRIFETSIDGFKKYTSLIDTVCSTTFLYRFSKSSSPIKYSANEVIRRAYSRIGESDYNLIFNNCEHFARWCRCGSSY